MVPVATLWAPILLSAVLVFVVSSVIHMLLGYHASDFGAVARQNDLLDALRGFTLSPGDYVLPRPASSAEAARRSLPLRLPGARGDDDRPARGWDADGAQPRVVVYLHAIVGLFAGYVAGLALGPGAEYRPVSASPAPWHSWATCWPSGRA